MGKTIYKLMRTTESGDRGSDGGGAGGGRNLITVGRFTKWHII